MPWRQITKQDEGYRGEGVSGEHGGFCTGMVKKDISEKVTSECKKARHDPCCHQGKEHFGRRKKKVQRTQDWDTCLSHESEVSKAESSRT